MQPLHHDNDRAGLLVVGVRRHDEGEETEDHRDQGEHDTRGAEQLTILGLEEAHLRIFGLAGTRRQSRCAAMFGPNEDEIRTLVPGSLAFIEGRVQGSIGGDP